MRARWFVLIGLALLSLAVPPALSEGKTPAEQPTFVAPGVLSHRVIAYYFHTTFRCASCRSIEAYSREAIESRFAGAIKDGRLVWRVVNVEVKGNEHFMKDYGLYTKSLVLVNEVRGKRSQWKNLSRVWELLPDKSKFVKYVQNELASYLAETS